MNHTTSKNFKPPALLAHSASISIAEKATDINISAGFREGKERWPEFVADVCPIELADKRSQGALELSERNSLINTQPFNLMKDTEAPGADRLITVDLSGYDDTNRGFLALHNTNLHRGSVRAEQNTLIEKECILHVSGGMVDRKIEGFKIVVIVLNLGSLLCGESHTCKDITDLIDGLDEGMLAAEEPGSPGETEVGIPWSRCAGFHLPESLIKGALQIAPKLIKRFPCRRAINWRELTHLLE
jgi:hypothetical protein